MEHTYKIRIAFSNFYDKYGIREWLTALLTKACDVEVVHFNEKPDILFFSIFEYDDNLICSDAIRVM